MANKLEPAAQVERLRTPTITDVESTFPLQNLPIDLILKIISNSGSVQELHSFSLTCKQFQSGLQTNLSQLLYLCFPHAKKANTSEEPMETLKEQFRIHSNLTKGIYASQVFKTEINHRCVASTEENIVFGYPKGIFKVLDLKANTWTTLHGPNSAVCSLALNQEKIISSFSDGTIQIWDLKTNLCSGAIINESPHIAKCLLLNQNKLFTGLSNGTIMIWNLETLSCIATLTDHTNPVETLALNQEKLFSGDSSGKIKIWNLNTNSCTASWEGHTSSISSFHFDQDRLISCTQDGGLFKIWDLKTNRYIGTLQNFNSVFATPALNQGKLFFLSSSTSSILIWDLKTKLYTATLHISELPWLKLFWDKNSLTYCSTDGTVRIWKFDASDYDIFKEIARSIESGDLNTIEETFDRFKKMPPKAKNAIYEIFAGLLNISNISPDFEDTFCDSTEDIWNGLKAQAIENYLETLKKPT